MGFRLPEMAGIVKRLHCNVLMIEYRGYGNSGGTVKEDDIVKDSSVGTRFIHFQATCSRINGWQTIVQRFLDSHKKAKGSPLILFGRSLGGAVAVQVAARLESQVSQAIRGRDASVHMLLKVSGVILENTFLSISEIVDAVRTIFCMVSARALVTEETTVIPCSLLGETLPSADEMEYLHIDSQTNVPNTFSILRVG